MNNGKRNAAELAAAGRAGGLVVGWWGSGLILGVLVGIGAGLMAAGGLMVWRDAIEVQEDINGASTSAFGGDGAGFLEPADLGRDRLWIMSRTASGNQSFELIDLLSLDQLRGLEAFAGRTGGNVEQCHAWLAARGYRLTLRKVAAWFELFKAGEMYREMWQRAESRKAFKKKMLLVMAVISESSPTGGISLRLAIDQTNEICQVALSDDDAADAAAELARDGMLQIKPYTAGRRREMRPEGLMVFITGPGMRANESQCETRKGLLAPSPTGKLGGSRAKAGGRAIQMV